MLTMLKKCVFFALLFTNLNCCRVSGQDQEYWIKYGQDRIKHVLDNPDNHNVAKNLILFLGDGMGISTVTAARILKGQQKGNFGEEEVLNFEAFPHSGYSKTYETNFQTGDSAGTATAFHCGVKTKNGAVGLDKSINRFVCRTHTPEAELTSVLQHALEAGKSTGFVTTKAVTDGSPAPLYAHSVARDYQAWAPPGCKDIAAQLVDDYPGRDINVILGTGKDNFLPRVLGGKRLDGRNLINDWLADKENRSSSHAFFDDLEGMDSVNPPELDYLMGLISVPSHHHNQRPTLPELTRMAIEVLQKNDNGFYLFVEGARIDSGHHSNKAFKALTETLGLEEAVDVALNMTNKEDTLIVVTADHSHSMTILGYPRRGKDILDTAFLGTDWLWHTTLLYGTGPGYTSPREDITEVDIKDPDYRQQSAVPQDSGSHSGEDVPVYSQGPMAHLLRGTFEQSYIAHAMNYAACVGPNKGHCDSKNTPPPATPTRDGAGNTKTTSIRLTVAMAMIVYFITRN